MDNAAAVLAEPDAKEHTFTPSYVSKFRPNVVLETKANKHAMKTMGPPNEELPDPRNYLKKHVGELRYVQKLEVERHIHPDKKPPIPPMEVKPPLKPPPDYVKQAIYKEYKTTQPVPKCVVNQHGDKVVVENLGRAKYILRNDYGLTPQYLQKRTEKEIKAKEAATKAEKEMKEAIVREKIEEQQAALECLKKTWRSLNTEYCHLPLIIETPGLKKHKQYLEENLDWVEKNIQYLEKCRAKDPFQRLPELQGTKH